MVATNGEDRERVLRNERALFEHSPSAVYCLDLDAHFIDFNPASLRLTGYTAEEGRHLSIRDLVAAEDQERAYLHFKDAVHGIPSIFECRILGKDGHLIHLEVTNFPMRVGDAIVGVYGIARDISNLKCAEAALKQSEARFKTIAQVTNDVVWDWDLKTDAVWWGAGYRKVFGYPDAPARATDLFLNIHVDDRERVMSGIQTAISNQATVWTDEYRYRRMDGSYAIVQDKGMITYDDEGQAIRMTGALVDITDRKQTEAQLVYLAQKDPLTGLANRNLFYDHLNLALQRARRHQQKMALMFMDLDRFKAINDALGHMAGDTLLKAVAGRLKQALRDADMVSRIGGDEFTVILEEIDQAEAVAFIAEKILATFAQPVLIDHHEIFVGTSIGIGIYPDDATTCDELVKRADAAMYHAKAQGRGNFQFYNTEMNAQAASRLEMETQMRKALRRRSEFQLYYQPQIDPDNRTVIGMEALLRWHNPTQGELLPDQFIPLAEETGMIIPLGNWVLRTACRQAKAWQEAGLGIFRMAVNLSSRQFRGNNLVKAIKRVLQDTDLSPSCLELEITESMVIEDAEATRAMLDELKALGVHISIDDFGTGYSSLSYLKLLPLDVLKIDKSFISNLPASANDAAISSAIINMAHGLALKVVAEGVETEQQADFLKAVDCDYTQGFLISPPLPAEEMAEFLTQFGQPQ